MKAKLYEDLIKRIVRDTEFNLDNADNLDVVRSAVTSGAVSENVLTLITMGYEAEWGDWEDRGCLRVGYVKIAGQIIVKNSEIDYYAVEKVLKNRPATAEEIIEATRQEVAGQIERSSTIEAKKAWYYTHCGELEMCRFLGLISADRLHELETAWKEYRPY